MSSFTPTQGRYLAFIHAYIDGFGEPPAESEIAEALQVSPPSVNNMMKRLESLGLIAREPGVPRSIRILVDPSEIPAWKKKITRTVYQWMPTRPPHPARRASSAAGAATAPRRSKADTGEIYRLKITLRHAEPSIWRRIETPDITLEQLHHLIQTAMGWDDYHLHHFAVGGRYYSDSRVFESDPDVEDAAMLRISDLVAQTRGKVKIFYEYDFGDGWEHDILVEKTTDADPEAIYPRCVEGERACPPEDVGGIYGYYHFLDAISDPKHPDHEEMLEWGGEHDPEKFDPEEATQAMRSLRYR